MLTTHSPSPREASLRRAQEAPSLDPAVWQSILNTVRAQHPSLHRVWFDQMVPRQLTNGVIQVTVGTPAQMSLCQSQCQQPFTAAAQQVTGRLVAVSFRCDNLPRGGVFNEGDQPLPLNPDYVFDSFVTGPCNRLPHAASVAVAEQPGRAYNPLYQGHKQIILSADCPPSEIPELEERLVSRFNWGLVARIEKPCYETRVAILKKKARMRGLELPDDVVCYIAAKVENNTRELEGAITKVQGMGLLQNGVIDLDLTKAALGDSATPEQRRITIQQIFDAVTKYYN